MVGLFVLLTNKKRISTGVSFACFAFFSFLWQLSSYFLFKTADEKFANIISRLGYTAIILTPIFFSGFLISFAGISIKNLKKHYIINFSIAFIFMLILWSTNSFIDGTYKYSFGFYPRVNWIHIIYLFWISYLFISAHFKLYLYIFEKNKTSLVEQKQLKFLIIGSLFYTVSLTDFFVSYGINFYPLGFVFTSIALVSYFHLISEGENIFLWIKPIYKYFFIKSFYFVVVLSLFIPTFLFAINKIYLQNIFISLIFCLLDIIVVLFFIKPFLDKKISNILFKIPLDKKQEYSDDLNKFIHENRYNLLRKKDREKIINQIFEILNLENINLYVYDSSNNDFVKEVSLGNTETDENTKFLTLDNPIIEYIKELNTYCFKPKIKDSVEKNLMDEIERLKAEVIYPINISVAATYLKHDNIKNKLDKLNAILMIGQKKNNEQFFKKDFTVLTEIVSLISKSIDYKVQLEHKLLTEIIQNQKYFITETSKWMEIDNLDELAKLVGESIKHHMLDIEKIQVFILNETTNKFECVFSDTKDKNIDKTRISISINSTFVRFIGNNKHLFMRDELKQEIENKEYSKEYLAKFYDDLEKLDGEVFQPIYSHCLLGFLTLSKKHKNRKYTMAEINRLDFLTYGAGVSIQKLMFNSPIRRDDVIKIFNKKYIDKLSSKNVKLAILNNEKITTIIIDIDYDSTATGNEDIVLNEFTSFLQNKCKSSDLVYIYSVKKIFILMSDTNTKQAISFIKSVRDEIKDLPVLSDISFNAGVSTFVPNKMDHENINHNIPIAFDRLFQSAERALTLSKEKGKKITLEGAEVSLLKDNFEKNICIVTSKQDSADIYNNIFTLRGHIVQIESSLKSVSKLLAEHKNIDMLFLGIDLLNIKTELDLLIDIKNKYENLEISVLEDKINKKIKDKLTDIGITATGEIHIRTDNR
jgi:diguanylate cyclase (GGDEF)-like protein